MTDSLDARIRAALDGHLMGKGVMDFESSPSAIRKGDEVLQVIQRQGVDLGSAAILSIGGADGTELVHLLQGTQAKHGLLFEVDDDLRERARARAQELAASGKTMRVFGDVIQKLKPALDVVQQWIESGTVRFLIVSMNAVLHELPNRGSGTTDLEGLLGQFLWRKVPVLAIAREPCMPAGLPERVYLKANCQPNNLAALASRIRDAHAVFKTEGPPTPMAQHVRLGSRLAVETIWKLFYLESLSYEIDEKITSFTKGELLTAFRNVFGTAHIRSSLLQTDSFDRLWSELGVQLQDEQLRDLAKPEIHVRIVATWSPPQPESPRRDRGDAERNGDQGFLGRLGTSPDTEDRPHRCINFA